MADTIVRKLQLVTKAYEITRDHAQEYGMVPGYEVQFLSTLLQYVCEPEINGIRQRLQSRFHPKYEALFADYRDILEF